VKIKKCMKSSICFVALAIVSACTNAGEPFVKTVYNGKNWSVIQVSAGSGPSQCALRSAPNFFEPGKPKYGSVFLEVSYPSNRITLSGDNIVMYFKIAHQTTLQVGQEPDITITPETPIPGKAIIDRMLANKGSAIKVNIDFGAGDPSIHTFSLKGFAEAYSALPACAKRSQ
jgi:hypothetical protein